MKKYLVLALLKCSCWLYHRAVLELEDGISFTCFGESVFIKFDKGSETFTLLVSKAK